VEPISNSNKDLAGNAERDQILGTREGFATVVVSTILFEHKLHRFEATAGEIPLILTLKKKRYISQ